jgi:hypothetical protein
MEWRILNNTMNTIKENKTVKRYALFQDLGHQYMLLVVGVKNIETAPRWGGFIKWIGGDRY